MTDTVTAPAPSAPTTPAVAPPASTLHKVEAALPVIEADVVKAEAIEQEVAPVVTVVVADAQAHDPVATTITDAVAKLPENATVLLPDKADAEAVVSHTLTTYTDAKTLVNEAVGIAHVAVGGKQTALDAIPEIVRVAKAEQEMQKLAGDVQGDGRAFSIAITHLESGYLWLKHALGK